MERIRALVPEGVDAVADFVGGQLETSLAVLADGGRQASIADPGVIEHGGRWIWVRPDGAESARLAALADEGELTVEVSQTFGLDEVAEAFALSQGRARPWEAGSSSPDRKCQRRPWRGAGECYLRWRRLRRRTG